MVANPLGNPTRVGTEMKPVVVRQVTNWKTEILKVSPKPLLMHCEAGKDRTGVMTAILLLLNGVSREDVLDEYYKSYQGRLPLTEERTKRDYPDLPSFMFHLKKETVHLIN